MTTGDMSVKVSLPSNECLNEKFLITKLMITCQIRMMDSVLNTNKLQWVIRLAPTRESWWDWSQRDIRQEQDIDTMLDQDFVAPALCYISL